MEDKLSESAEQSDELQQLVDDVKGEDDHSEHDVGQTADNNDDTEEDIDILNLPPRSDIHRESRSRLKVKIPRALTSFIIVIAVLLVAFGTAFYFWEEELWTYIMNM